MNNELLFFDTLTGVYFTSTIGNIRRLENEINREACLSPNKERYFDLVNKLRSELRLPEIPNFWVHFFTKPDGSLLDVKFATVVNGFGMPCVLVDFDIHKTKYKVKVRKKRSV